MTTPQAWLRTQLDAVLTPEARGWLETHLAQVAAGADDVRFASLLSLASRHTPRGPLAPDGPALEAAGAALEGWNPERWDRLEAVRVSLILARPDLDTQAGVEGIEEAFRYADEGEARALYKSLALLPDGARFRWRAGEGCRSNIVPVFESAACDSPFACTHFDDVAWRQLLIKAVFIGAPLWRVFGLDRRLSPELARMALDLADERRSAGRPVQPELWLCLGAEGGERGLQSLERELDPANASRVGRLAAVLGLARAGQLPRLARRVEAEGDAEVATLTRAVLAGPPARYDASAFRSLASSD